MFLTPDDEDFEWEPPTEAEMKVIQARRERQDKISKLMGDYLLKGYKMLGECCDVCGVSEVHLHAVFAMVAVYLNVEKYNVLNSVCCMFPDNSPPRQTAEKLLCLMSGAGL